MKSLSEITSKAISSLEDFGYKAFVVGGYVRNMLMNIPASDADICTNALPHEIINVFSEYKTIETGIVHGTVTVIIENTPLEITTFRLDGEYISHRKPESVSFTSSLSEDLSRRDFTINAMALDICGNIYDPFGGKADLEKKIIRCVGNAEKRFSEDALRILRALRFASVLGFTLESETEKAIFKSYPLLSHISAERITSEFLKLLTGSCAEYVLTRYKEIFLFLSGADTEAIAKKLSLYENCAEIRLALFPDADFLRLPEKTKRKIEFLRNNLNTLPASHFDILKLLSENGEDNVRLFLYSSKNTPALNILDEIIKSGMCFNVRMLKISGDDLKSLGFKGADIGKKLKEILYLVMKNKLKNNKNELVSYAKKNIF